MRQLLIFLALVNATPLSAKPPSLRTLCSAWAEYEKALKYKVALICEQRGPACDAAINELAVFQLQLEMVLIQYGIKCKEARP